MRSLIILVFMLVFAKAFAQSDLSKGIVMIDSKGHSANIKMLRFSDDGNTLITASDDKTARVWDVKTGALLNTLRGEIDDGNGGMLNSGAIWPGKPITVLGGFLSINGKSEMVKFFNYETGEQLGYATGPSNPMVALDFSPDGKFLAGGSVGSELAIWNLDSFKPIRLSGHTGGVYGVAFSPNGESLVTGSYDSTVIFWNVKFLHDSTQQLATKVHRNHTAKVRTVAFSPKGDFFASGGEDNRVLLYNGKGEFVKELIKILDPVKGEEFGVGDIHSLAFSDDGKKIAIGTGLSNYENVWVVEVATGKKISSFFKHDNSVMALDFFGNDLIASAGGDNRDIYVWDALSGKVVSSMQGQGRRISAVAFGKDNKIAFSQKMNTPTERSINEFGSPDKVFDLGNLAILPFQNNDKNFQGVRTEYNNTVLRLQSVSRLVMYNASAEIIHQIDLDPGRDGGIRSYTFTEDGKVVIGTQYRIILFNQNCERLKELNGHTAEIYSVAVRGNRLVSGSADQTIKMWNLDDEGAYGMTKDEYRKMLENQGVTEERLNGYLKQNSKTFDQLYLESTPKEIKPLLTIFPTLNEWIVFDKNNYYATSKNGSKLVGFHINNGNDKASTFYNFRQFDYQLNRPDLVLKALGTANQSLMAALKTAHEKRIKRSGYAVQDNNTLVKAPELTLRNQPQVVQEQKFKLRFNLSGVNLKKISVTVNSVPVDVSGGDASALYKKDTQITIIYDVGFELLPGKNTVEVWATDINGVSSSVKSFTVVYNQKDAPKPDLYIVSIGASNYSQASFNLTYAAKDANDVVNQFSSSTTLYGKVNRLLLTDEKVTAAAITNIKSFLSPANIRDKVIFFYAGHGLFDAKFDYYLASWDMDFNNPSAKGLSYESIEQVLAGVKARSKLVLIDACHSGEIDKEEVQAKTTTNTGATTSVKFRNVGSDITYKTNLGMQSSFSLMKGMFADLQDQTGANVISSAGGLELAMESEKWKNGLFTYVLLEGLQNRTADQNKDGEISISELTKHLRENVSRLSEGKQVPTTRTENIEGDFRVW